MGSGADDNEAYMEVDKVTASGVSQSLEVRT